MPERASGVDVLTSFRLGAIAGGTDALRQAVRIDFVPVPLSTTLYVNPSGSFDAGLPASLVFDI
jgi:hypothetical protein